MKIELFTETLVKVEAKIVFFKQTFRFNSYCELDNGQIPSVNREETKTSFIRYLISSVKEFDDWENRQGYNDFILRKHCEGNAGLSEPLLFLPVNAKIRELAEKAEQEEDWEELISYLVKDEERLTTGWEPEK